MHCCSRVSQMLTCIFIFVQLTFLFPLGCPLWLIDYLEVHCLVPKCLEIFLLYSISVMFFSCYWFLVWFHCSQKTHSVWFQLFWICRCLSYGSGHGILWRMFRGHLEIMCIPLWLGTVFCKCWLDPVGQWWCSVLLYLCWLCAHFFYQQLREGC